MLIAKRLDKVDVIRKFLETRGLDKDLWYALCKFADFEYRYNTVIQQKINEECDHIRLLKQQSREIGAKLKSMRNNGNVDGWLYPLICKKHKEVVCNMRDRMCRKGRLVEMLNEMTEDANTGHFSKSYPYI